MEAEVGRDAAVLKAFEFHSGEHSELTASGSLNHFDNPQWQAKLVGSLELKQLQILAGVDGLDAGTLDVSLAGHNCYVAPAEAQKRPKIWQRLRSKKEAQTSVTKTLPPDSECAAGYLLLGGVKTHRATYINQYVRVENVNASAQLKSNADAAFIYCFDGILGDRGKRIG